MIESASSTTATGSMARSAKAAWRSSIAAPTRCCAAASRSRSCASSTPRTKSSSGASTRGQSAAKLSHPNIVNTYDVGREGATYYIVMELVDGPSLAEIIAADGKLPEPVAIDYAAQICSGLAYAHGKAAAPRHQAGQHPGHQRRRRQALRLRHRAGGLAADDRDDQAGNGDGQRLLHVARTGAGQRTARDLRPVQRRRRAVPDAHGQVAVHRRVAGHGRAQAHRRPGARASIRASSASVRRSPRSSAGCCRSARRTASNRRANSRRRCAKRASARTCRPSGSRTTRQKLARRRPPPASDCRNADAAVRTTGDMRQMKKKGGPPRRGMYCACLRCSPLPPRPG